MESGDERVSFILRQDTLRAALRVRSGPAKGAEPRINERKTRRDTAQTGVGCLQPIIEDERHPTPVCACRGAPCVGR